MTQFILREGQSLREEGVIVIGRMEYEDFEISILPKRGDVCPVEVESPAGEGHSFFRLPFSEDALRPLLIDLGRKARGVSRGDAPPEAAQTAAQRLGSQLFDALFTGSVRSLFAESRGWVFSQKDKGLRIKLKIDPDQAPELAQLASLPWEYLYRKETRDFLNLSRRTPLVRYFKVERARRPLTVELPLRMLVAISNPSNYPPLDLEKEKGLIIEALGGRDDVMLEFMETATVSALQNKLEDNDYHVLHYMGHGGFEEDTGRGVLLLEDEDRKGHAFCGEDLGDLLRDSSIGLVFLNACETARLSEEEGRDPFWGVAAALVNKGIPAVVAMQFPISDEAAIILSQKLYTSLADGRPIDEAVTRGRRAIKFIQGDTYEWGTPVLFMRAPDGVIFNMAPTAEEAVTPPVKEPLTRAGPKWVGIGLGVIAALLVLGGIIWMVSGREQATPTPISTPILWVGIGLGMIAALLVLGGIIWMVSGREQATPTPTSTPILTPVATPSTGAALAEPEEVSSGARQVFQRGYMFWRERPGTDWIYVLYFEGGTNMEAGDWKRYDDTWKEGDQLCEKPPPLKGLKQPVRGFGRVWCDKPNVREKMGWSLQEEEGIGREGEPTFAVQEFENGTILWVEDIGYFLHKDGIWWRHG